MKDTVQNMINKTVVGGMGMGYKWENDFMKSMRENKNGFQRVQGIYVPF